ncbi:hypothetical protein GUITHDRAFT_107916 [Guillardia theta CCMP2712]|uniref:Uncharacterized protein n=1 Tax=Guillardia theta (strain CCMP2712) TaxID=905079 RepID=L1JCT4_GUITC|nr:hypothetical protein GUITHDRAFT_107916 [Guillardia theta CCMP2712]EKX46306.1 hypothetical protein GUITHDRAFT_107916 [Guillardia theta CCMP2712]|eukprot:XP_005833286.1 hypothetical protein GUITHDRAFT_107916 [Guillardia theta CCMP2712]
MEMMEMMEMMMMMMMMMMMEMMLHLERMWKEIMDMTPRPSLIFGAPREEDKRISGGSAKEVEGARRVSERGSSWSLDIAGDKPHSARVKEASERFLAIKQYLMAARSNVEQRKIEVQRGELDARQEVVDEILFKVVDETEIRTNTVEITTAPGATMMTTATTSNITESAEGATCSERHDCEAVSRQEIERMRNEIMELRRELSVMKQQSVSLQSVSLATSSDNPTTISDPPAVTDRPQLSFRSLPSRIDRDQVRERCGIAPYRRSSLRLAKGCLPTDAEELEERKRTTSHRYIKCAQDDVEVTPSNTSRSFNLADNLVADMVTLQALDMLTLIFEVIAAGLELCCLAAGTERSVEQVERQVRGRNPDVIDINMTVPLRPVPHLVVQGVKDTDGSACFQDQVVDLLKAKVEKILSLELVKGKFMSNMSKGEDLMSQLSNSLQELLPFNFDEHQLAMRQCFLYLSKHSAASKNEHQWLDPRSQKLLYDALDSLPTSIPLNEELDDAVSCMRHTGSQLTSPWWRPS